MKENESKFLPKEVNTQKRDIFKFFRSNSQNHYRNISDYNYNHRIKLNPSGEVNTIDIREQFPISHLENSLIKSDYLSEKHSNKNSAFDNADIQSKITLQVKKQKYQTLLEKNKKLENLCKIKNNEIKSDLEKRKIKLKEKLTRIINDALLFSKKNNPVKSMLPENINEIVEKFRKQSNEVNMSLNVSNLSKITSIGKGSKQTKNEFLSMLGVDLENLAVDNVKVDINKAWDFILKISKGKKVEDILRFKVVNAIMSLTEQKASEKARKLYEKMEIFKKYKEQQKNEEIKRKQKEEDENYQKMVKNNPRELIKQRMMKSLSQPQLFNQDENELKKKKNLKKQIKKKKMHRSESATFPVSQKKLIRLNAYKDVNKIINFIDYSKKESQSKVCKPHFMNIKIRKNADTNIQKMIKNNGIIVSY